jgi:hypothetical protein
VKNLSKIIQTILEDIAQPGIPAELEYQIVIDKERQHYQVLVSGWQGTKRTYGILVQIDVKGDLIWVQEDNTDYRVADALVEAGIPKDKIVLGFHAPYKRQYTGFATGE